MQKKNDQKNNHLEKKSFMPMYDAHIEDSSAQEHDRTKLNKYGRMVDKPTLIQKLNQRLSNPPPPTRIL